jgi:hypothetical protein
VLGDVWGGQAAVRLGELAAVIGPGHAADGADGRGRRDGVDEGAGLEEEEDGSEEHEEGELVRHHDW